MNRFLKNKDGQATTEYILLIAVVVSFFLIASSGLSQMGASRLLMQPISGPFAAAYQFGKVDAKGWENGSSPVNHPRAEGGSGNFRIFLGSTP